MLSTLKVNLLLYCIAKYRYVQHCALEINATLCETAISTATTTGQNKSLHTGYYKTLLAILVLSLMTTLLSLTKYLLALKLAIMIFENIAVFALQQTNLNISTT